MQKPQPKDITTELRQRFEDDMQRKFAKSGVDLERTKAGMYKCKRIQLWWMGYKLAHESENGINRASPVPATRFIVGRVEDDNGTKKFRMAPVPYRHLVRKAATEEAQRLANLHGGQFAIFRCVDIASPTEQEVVE